MVIPSAFGIYPVTTIGESAFYNCTGLTNITIPNSVTSIERYALGYCRGLKSITLPNSLTDVGPSALYECTRPACNVRVL